MDEIAKLYISLKGKHYRFKVFAHSVWIERRPDGQNVPIRRPETAPDVDPSASNGEVEPRIHALAWALYNTEMDEWNYEAIGELISRYEAGELS